MGWSENSGGVTREWVEAFNEAYAGRHMDRLASLLDDDVRWVISGPVDLMPFCGERRGKQAVLDMVARVAPAAIRRRQLYAGAGADRRRSRLHTLPCDRRIGPRMDAPSAGASRSSCASATRRSSSTAR